MDIFNDFYSLAHKCLSIFIYFCCTSKRKLHFCKSSFTLFLSLFLYFYIFTYASPVKWSTIKMFATHSEHLLQYMLYILDTHLHTTHIEPIKLNSFIPLRDRNTQHRTALGRFWLILCTCVSCRKNRSNYFLDSLSHS